MNAAKKVTMREVQRRLDLLERDRDRLAILMSCTRHMLQVVTSLGTGLSSVASLTSSTSRTSVKTGTAMNVFTAPASEFLSPGSPRLELLMGNVFHDNKS